jgi:Spy/CpxP family protein refolding chaperone
MMMREHTMDVRLTLLVAGLALSLAATPALAFHCPSVMAEIDEALPEADLTDEERAQLEELRAEGERLHNEGQHQESLDTLAEAQAILGTQQ